MTSILRCPNCQTYTLEESCSCGEKTLSPKPPKYSPEDKFGSYRREAKREQWNDEGIL